MKTDDMKLKVVIIIGGKSVEHDISILSGLQVYNALDSQKYCKRIIYINKNNEMLIGRNLHKIETYKNNNFKHCRKVHFEKRNHQGYYCYGLKKEAIDLCIPVVHGEGIEDGTLSGILSFFDIPYVTSDIVSSSIAQDKVFTKDILKNYQINTPKYLCITNQQTIIKNIEVINHQLTLPVMVKPVRLGSSIGINKCHNNEELHQALLEGFRYSQRIIIEEVVPNMREFNCAAFITNNQIMVSAIEEVLYEKDFLTFLDKYTKPLNKLDNATNRIIPAIISLELETKIKEYTQKIYETLNMKGVVRIDYLYDEVNDELYFNEINTIPGSYAFYLYDKIDINFPQLLDKLIKETLLKAKENNLTYYFSSNILASKGTTKLEK